MTTVQIRIEHASSIPGARWCTPIGWQPANEIPGSQLIDGSWYDEHEEVAALVYTGDGSDGDIREVPLDELRVALCGGDCRILGAVELSDDDTYEITEYARAVESKRWARWQLELRDRLLAAGQHDFSTVEFPSDEGGVLVIHGPRGWWVLDPDLEGEAPFFARLLAIESVGTTDELIDHCLAHMFVEDQEFWLVDGDYEPVVDEDVGDQILWDSQVALDRLAEKKA